MSNHPRWIAAARASGRVSFLPIFEQIGGAHAFPRCSEATLLDAGLPLFVLESCRGGKAQKSLAREAQHTLYLGEPGYPQRLLDLPKPPPVLWAHGELGLLEASGLAVVGARACTPYGKRIASQLGRMESASGGVLISGAARGIDAAAHRGALETGRTLAVLGAGLEARAGHARKRFFETILGEGGLILSEFPSHDPPQRWTFPLRNRVVAALSRATVVVEAALRSGARITSGLARDLGREVFAVPGPIDAPASMGCNQLIEEGARPLLRLSDAILDRNRASSSTLPELLRVLLGGPMTLSALSSRTGKALPLLNQEVGHFEICGLVKRMPGGRIGLG